MAATQSHELGHNFGDDHNSLQNNNDEEWISHCAGWYDMGYVMYENTNCRHLHQTYSSTQAATVASHQNRFAYFSS